MDDNEIFNAVDDEFIAKVREKFNYASIEIGIGILGAVRQESMKITFEWPFQKVESPELIVDRLIEEWCTCVVKKVKDNYDPQPISRSNYFTASHRKSLVIESVDINMDIEKNGVSRSTESRYRFLEFNNPPLNRYAVVWERQSPNIKLYIINKPGKEENPRITLQIESEIENTVEALKFYEVLIPLAESDSDSQH